LQKAILVNQGMGIFNWYSKSKMPLLQPLHKLRNLPKKPELYPWLSAKFYEAGTDDFGFLTHYA
jgi:hypothetical protein